MSSGTFNFSVSNETGSILSNVSAAHTCNSVTVAQVAATMAVGASLAVGSVESVSNHKDYYTVQFVFNKQAYQLNCYCSMEEGDDTCVLQLGATSYSVNYSSKQTPTNSCSDKSYNYKTTP